MQHDQGAMVSLVRESSSGGDTAAQVRLVAASGVARRSATDGATVRAIRTPAMRRVRRRLAWSLGAATALAAELVIAIAVIGWATLVGDLSGALVAMVWAVTQAGGTTIGRDARRARSVIGTVRRAEAGAVAVVVVTALGWMGRSDVATFVALASLSLVIRGVVALTVRRLRPSLRTMVVGRSHDLPSAVARLHSPDVTTYCISDVDAATRGEHLQRAILAYGPDRVVVPAGVLNANELQELSWAIEDHDIDVIVSMAGGSLEPHRLQPVNQGDVCGVRLKPRDGMLGDRLMDVAQRVAAGALLLVLGPVMLVVAALVRMDSKGPSLFIQQRVGKHGRTFPMVKFRTMHVDAEAMLHALLAENESEGGVLFKMRGDPRVTRIGAFLRATSIDELPQLINVVKGEMALIGPRPALPREVAEYDTRARRRLAVRPGITGLWQVSGRSNLSFEEAVRLDIDYVDNWSLRREVAIVFRTVSAVVRREGAY